jgi:membrane associated rhomboid family serine protease
MSWFQKFEKRYHNFGIPGLLRIVAIMQVLVYVLILLNPQVTEVLRLNFDLVKEGQIWRLFTFALLPNSLDIVGMLFAVLMLLWVGDALESDWGAFRVTLYYFGTIAMMVLASRFGPIQFISSELIYLSIFLAFATTFPSTVINLYGILPVPAKWLGWLDLARIGFLLYTLPQLRVGILMSLAPFLLLAVPIWIRHSRQRIRVGYRRAEFASASLPKSDHFHKCAICGRTDTSNPELEFRVMPDDTEVCMDHLPG